jgi:hypothetical protein
VSIVRTGRARTVQVPCTWYKYRYEEVCPYCTVPGTVAATCIVDSGPYERIEERLLQVAVVLLVLGTESRSAMHIANLDRMTGTTIP